MKPNMFRTAASIMLAVGSLSLTACGGITIQPTPDKSVDAHAQPTTPVTPSIDPAKTEDPHTSNTPNPPDPTEKPETTSPTEEPDSNGSTKEPDSTKPTEEPEHAAPKQATYRITINGIQAHHETWDHAGEVDGRRDEIQVAVAAKHLDENGKSLLPVRVSGDTPSDQTSASGDTLIAQTSVMGDATKDRRADGTMTRIPAGSAWHPLPFGGIQTGDKVGAPGYEPWAPLVSNPFTDKLPLKVGEFTLTEGKDTLTITPTIWEIDGGSDLPSEWVKWLRDEGGNVPVFGGIVKEVGKLAGSLFDNVIGHAGDRPIGIQKQNADGYEFAPQALEITYSTAESLVNGTDSGIVSMTYKDFKNFAGHYQLWIEVKKIV